LIEERGKKKKKKKKEGEKEKGKRKRGGGEVATFRDHPEPILVSAGPVKKKKEKRKM